MSPVSRVSAEIFLFAFVLGFACVVLRVGYELVRPMLWLLCPLAVLMLVGAGILVYVRWRRTYWG